VASLLLGLVLGIQARSRVLEKHASTQAGQFSQVNDFERWMRMAPQFLNRAAPAHYEDDSLPNPPLILLAFAPFTYLSPANAQLDWAVAKGAIIAVLWLLAASMARRAGVRLSPAALLLLGAVWIWPVMGDLQEGQTNLLMLLPLMLGLWALQDDDRAKQALGGAMLGLAVCVKVTPVIFLAYLLWRRRWTAAGGMVGGIAAGLLLIPALFFGWDQNWQWLSEWWHIMIVPYVAHGKVEYFVGQSLPSFLTRLLRHVPAFDHRGGGQVFVNLVDWPEAVVNNLIRAVLLVLAGGGLWWMRKRLPNGRSLRYLFEIGAVATMMLWASQRTWVPHYVSLLLPLVGVAALASDIQQTSTARRRAMAALIAAGGLMALTSDLAKSFGPDGPEFMRTIGVSIWASTALIAVLASTRTEPAPEARP